MAILVIGLPFHFPSPMLQGFRKFQLEIPTLREGLDKREVFFNRFF